MMVSVDEYLRRSEKPYCEYIDGIVAPVIQSPYPTEPVLLGIEILSPTDRLGAVLAKCEQYNQWGVPFCWVVLPDKQTAWQYHADGELSVSPEELFRECS